MDDHDADPATVGAGIAGLASAYMLLREGRAVTVIEAGVLAGGETARTTAHLSFALDDRYYELERLFGERGAKLAYQSHAAAVDLIERIVSLNSWNATSRAWMDTCSCLRRSLRTNSIGSARRPAAPGVR